MRAGASWSTSPHAGASWSTSPHVGASWSTSPHAGASWSTSPHAGAIDPLINTRELLIHESTRGSYWSTNQHAGASWSSQHAARRTSFQGGAIADNSRDVGLPGPPSSGSAWTWSVCPLARNQMFQVGLLFQLFQMFQHSTDMTFFFFSAFLLLQEQLICSSPPSGQGVNCNLSKWRMALRFFRSMTENIRLTRPLVTIYIH